MTIDHINAYALLWKLMCKRITLLHSDDYSKMMEPRLEDLLSESPMEQHCGLYDAVTDTIVLNAIRMNITQVRECSDQWYKLRWEVYTFLCREVVGNYDSPSVDWKFVNKGLKKILTSPV